MDIREQKDKLLVAAKLGQLEFGYVDWDTELPHMKEQWLDVMREVRADSQKEIGDYLESLRQKECMYCGSCFDLPSESTLVKSLKSGTFKEGE